MRRTDPATLAAAAAPPPLSRAPDPARVAPGAVTTTGSEAPADDAETDPSPDATEAKNGSGEAVDPSTATTPA